MSYDDDTARLAALILATGVIAPEDRTAEALAIRIAPYVSINSADPVRVCTLALCGVPCGCGGANPTHPVLLV